MPATEVVLYAGDDATSHLLKWLDQLPDKVRMKCIVRIERLQEMGSELRRPEADFLRDGIYELRVSFRGIQYRMLYFFHGKVAVISHGLTKEGKVPDKEIDIAIERKGRFETDPQKHTYEYDRG